METHHVPPVPVIIRESPRVGAVFGLGWLMAKLFDSRRRASVYGRVPPFDKTIQLPLVEDLDFFELLKFLVTDLHDLLAPFPDVSDADVQTEAAKRPGTAEPFDQGRFDVAVGKLHLDILDQFADDDPQLNSYQLGLALSDMCWLATPAAGPDTFIGMFRRDQVAIMQTWLDGAGPAIPPSAASVVGQSLSKWADWTDVNAPKFRATASTWAATPEVVTGALRLQGEVWHSVLTADPNVSLDPAMGAWVQAGSATARAVGKVTGSIVRRFWPAVVLTAAALAGLLYLVISNLSGASQTWASLVTVGAVLGAGGASLGSGVSRAMGGIGFEIWTAAKLDAQAWNITWLPAVQQGAVQRTKLDGRGVAAPRIRKNVDGQ
jgi:hypothetical protein